MRSSISALALHLLILAGCVDSQETADLIAVRDSGGVVFIDVSPGSGRAIDLITAAPTLTVGAGGDGVDLHGVSDVRFVDDKRILIADVGSQEIIAVNVATGQVRRWGGRGYGPLEFRMLTSLAGSTAEEIVAFDQARRRVVRIDYEGELVGEWLLPESVAAGSTLRTHQSGNGAFYLAEIPNLSPPSSIGIYRGVAPLLRLKPTLDTVAMLKGAATFRSEGSIGGVLFGATSVVASSSDGVWVGDNNHPEVVLWNDRGQLAAVIRWEGGARRLTAERIREFWRRVEREMPEPNPSALREMQSVLPIADTLPAFGAIIEADDGHVWIGSYVSSEHQMFGDRWPRQEWLVIDRSTPSVWRAATPEGFRLIQVAHGSLLGVQTDDLGVQSVRAYSLRDILPVEDR